MRLCIAGKNNIAVDAVKYIIESELLKKENLFVLPNKNISNEDTWQKSLKKYALDNNLQITNLDKMYRYDDLIFISLEFDKIINTNKFKTNKLYNIHFSYLPAYKGVYTSIFPILKGETESGVTLHKIDNGIDTGDIIEQIKFDIGINETARDLYFKYLKFGFELFKKNIRKILLNDISLKKQNNIKASYFSRKSIDLQNIDINFNKTSFEIHNQIRSMIFKEYQLPNIKGKKIKKSILLNEKMREARKIIEFKDRFEISGIDRYIIKAYKN